MRLDGSVAGVSLRDPWEGFISGVEMSPGKTRGGHHPVLGGQHQALAQGQERRAHCAPLQGSTSHWQSGVVGQGSPRPGKADRQTGSQGSYVCKAQGQTPGGTAPLAPRPACCLSHGPYGRRLRLVTSRGSRAAAEAASEARVETQAPGKGARLRDWASQPRPGPAGDTDLPLGINGPLGSQKL